MTNLAAFTRRTHSCVPRRHSWRRLFSTALLLLAALAAAQPSAPAPLLGTAWYPEQWPESRWEADLQLMQNAGIRMVRVGEFAWSTMEPAEGQFRFEWLERAVALAAKHGIVTVVGTPTAAPPAWLTQKYPDTLKTFEHGQKATHGGREQYSFTSPRYLQFCRRITEEMAKRFGKNPNVVGWQIDNEYGDTSWDEVTRHEWQDWLREKYGTLSNLNEHWTTSYWSETITDWSQIPLGTADNNPGLRLEFRRFVTAMYKKYQHNEVEAIRAHAEPRQFITSNFMGWYDAFDHYVLSEDLDFASWDNYVGRGHLKALDNGIVHDLTRGLKRKNFWVMETQPGFVNWSPVNNALDRGEVRAMAWHAIGHGADTVSYWQWRSALSGQEQYHGTLVGADGTPVPLYDEVAQIGREFAKASDALAGTSPASAVAILHSYDSRWAINNQRHHQDFDPEELLRSYYRPLRALAQQMDVVNPMAPLAQYKLVVAPGLNVLPAEVGRHLIEYVNGGGHLVLGPRSGMKDDWNALWPERQPGPLVPLLGGRVEQWYALDEKAPATGQWGNGAASIWAEQLGSFGTGAETLMTYGKSNGWLDGQPAAISRQVGKGRITYIAAWLDETTMRSAAEWMLRISGVQPAFGAVPEGVEVSRREGNGKEAFILVNHTKDAKSVTLPRAMSPVLAGGEPVTSIELPPRGVEVLRPAGGAAISQNRPAASENTDLYYPLAPDAVPRDGVPKGEIRGPFTLPSQAYPGTQHTYWIYVPAQYDPATPASLMIYNDGQAFMAPEGDVRAQFVMNNLIYRREIPVMIAVFINPGRRPDQPEPNPGDWGDRDTNRPTEYNTLDDKYARVIVDELLPALYKDYNLSKDPERHGIGGSSSGAIAAFTVAWERPDQFRKVLSNVGSFTNIRGGHAYPDIIRKSETKPIRVFLVDGRNDNRSLKPDGTYDQTRDWFYQNVRMQQALTEKGYDVNYSWGIQRHGQKMLQTVFPEMMRWLWRDHGVSTDVHDMVERSFNGAKKQP